VGPKTSRFFLLHTRPGSRYAVLDAAALKYLARNGVRVPPAPPAKGPGYVRLEAEALALADRAGMAPAEFDLFVRAASAASP
jgi:hypothetical protein